MKCARQKVCLCERKRWVDREREGERVREERVLK